MKPWLRNSIVVTVASIAFLSVGWWGACTMMFVHRTGLGMLERWLPVVGYEGLYEVSDMGRVRSLGRTYSARHSRFPDVLVHYTVKPRLMRTAGKTYQSVMLRDSEGSKWQPKVHRLVLAAFVGDQPHKQCNHKNGNPKDNRLNNLEWASCQENIIHSTRVLKRRVGEQHYKAKLTAEQVLMLRQVKAAGGNISALARELGVTEFAARSAAAGMTWKTLPMPGEHEAVVA